MSEAKRRILFLCTGNCIRSQMAEGWLRHLAGEKYECLSAGASPAGFVHRIAIKVMHEQGIDISRYRSKSIREFLPPEGTVPDVLISVCESAHERCPQFPAEVTRLLWPFDDPYYADFEGEDLVNEFRRVRDQICATIEQGIATGLI